MMDEFGPRAQAFLDNYTALQRANPGAANIDLVAVLDDPSLRSRLLEAVTDTTVLRFWEWYDALSSQDQDAVTDAVKNRFYLDQAEKRSGS